MERDELLPGLDVIYHRYGKTVRYGKGKNRAPYKEEARVIRIGKHRVTIQLLSDGTFRYVDPASLKRYKRETA